MKHSIKWQRASGRRGVWFTEAPRIGRYVVCKKHRSGTWIALRNGEPTSLHESSLSAIKLAVENVIKAVL